MESGHGTYIPAFLSDIPILLSHGRVPVDYTLLNVSMPDKHGYCSLGTEVCVARDAIKSTKKAVIAQLNPNVPRTLGHSSVHMNEFNYVVDVTGNPDAKIVTKEPPKLTQADKQIGRILAEMVFISLRFFGSIQFLRFPMEQLYKLELAVFQTQLWTH